MPKITVEPMSLADEIIMNAKRDRKRLERIADGLISGFESLATPGSDVTSETGLDSDVVTAYAEEIAKVSDSLTKINHELVELVKSERKGQRAPVSAKLPQDELEDVLNEIQPEAAEFDPSEIN